MCSVPTEVPATERARWLAELSKALDDANGVIARLVFRGDQRATAQELHLRIEAARLEVQALRLSRSLNARGEPSPKWTDPVPWHPSSSVEG